MLKYIEAGLSYKEIPNEICLIIYVSGCMQRCKECHTPWLRKHNYGDKLLENYKQLIDLYSNYISCVCFLGEGLNTEVEHNEYKEIVKYIHQKGLKAGLYSGRDTTIEVWMKIFDYIKLGSYQKDKGTLYNKNTNQRLYKKESKKYIDITNLFWNE